MSTYIVKRLLLMIPTLIGITFLTYVIIRSAPGNPTAMKGDLEKGPQRQTLTAGDQGDYKKLLHLDKPAYVAYFYWIGDFFNPKANVSSKYKVFVFDVILDRLPNTILLNLYGIIVLYLIGLPLGIDSAVNSRTTRERVITLVLFFLYSLPSFWVGLNLIVLFGRGGRLQSWLPDGLAVFRWLIVIVVVMFIIERIVRRAEASERRKGAEPGAILAWGRVISGGLAWLGVFVLGLGGLALLSFMVGNGLSIGETLHMVASGEIPGKLVGLPIAGLQPENADEMSYLTMLKASAPYFLMPMFCLSYQGLAGESRFMRVGLMEILRSDFVRTARSKGLSSGKVITRHALPNALTPIIVGIAGIFPGLIGGAVIIETIFSVPGMGLLFFEAVSARDYNLVMAETFVGAVLVLFGTLVSDLMLPMLDPRVTFEARET